MRWLYNIEMLCNARLFLLAVPALIASNLGLGAELENEQASTGLPNVIIILADDLGYGDIGIYGNREIKTPHIDAIASRGVRFTSGYVSAAVCSPSRAGLMTGRYQGRQGYDFNFSGKKYGLLKSERTLGEALRAVGYATGYFGKWHLGSGPRQRPQARGFDEFFGMMAGTIYIEPDKPGVENWTPPGTTIAKKRQRPIYRGSDVIEESDYLTDALTRETLQFVERHRDEPFFVYMAHYAPHVPLQATAKYIERYRHIKEKRRRVYAAMVSAVDDSVGAVMQKLRETGVEENTVVFFLSDNGCALYTGGACSNSPFNGGKRYHYDGGTRVPFLMQWPKQIPAGIVYDHPVISLDIFATSLAAVGSSGDPALDGVDLVPFLIGDHALPPHERLMWRAGPNRAIREGQWKLWQVNKTDPGYLKRLNPAGLIPGWEAPTGSPRGQLTLLFDVSKDPGETVNLTPQHPELVKRLKKRLGEWNGELIEPRWNSNRGTAVTIDGVAVEIIF